MRWRRQCRQGQFIDPVQYAVPPRYLGRKEDESIKTTEESNHSEITRNSLVEQLNHHRNSIHSPDLQELANSQTPTGSNNTGVSQEDFETWNLDGTGTERYSEFRSKNRIKAIPQNKMLSQFQSYSVVDNVESDQDPESIDRRKESDQVEVEDIEAKLDNLKIANSNEQSQGISQSVDVVLPKTRPNRSSSDDGRKKSSSGRRKSGSSRFKKDAYCDSFVDQVTLRTFQGRLESLLPLDVLKTDRCENNSDRPRIPYAYAARVMGLIEIAVTPRVTTCNT